MSKLNATDLELLQTGQTIDLSSTEYAYLGGEFTENPNDYIEVLIYDTNETFLESAVVDSGDYIYDEGEGIKLKTGTILRKLGYDRGRYVVKYNFLRKVAGSYENVLVDINNERYTEEFDPSNPTDRAKIGKSLFIKEYKYLIHEISPTRKEVRLIPLNIKDEKYLRDFYNIQHINKRVKSSGIQGLSGLNFKDDSNGLGQSYQLEVEDSTAQFLQQMVGGTITLPDVFIVDQYQRPPPPGWISQDAPTDELYSQENLQALFYISNYDTALLEDGSAEGIRSPFGAIYERFTGITDDIIPAAMDKSGVYSATGWHWESTGFVDNIVTRKVDDSETINTGQNFADIKSLNRGIFNPPAYKPEGEIIIKSVSRLMGAAGSEADETENPSINYTWEITGWENDQPSGINRWEQLVADEDVIIHREDSQGGEGFIITEMNSTNGSQIRITLNSWDMHIGIKLTIKEDITTSTLHLPCCIETTRLD